MVVAVAVAAAENCAACSLVETTAVSQLPILAATRDAVVAVAEAAVEDCVVCSLAATAADATWVALDTRLIAVDATAVAVADVVASVAVSSVAVHHAVAIHVLTSMNPLVTNTETPACKVPSADVPERLPLEP